MEDMCYDIDERTPAQQRAELAQRLAVLEEFARAFLWNENLIDNFGMMAQDGEPIEAESKEFSNRVYRLQQAVLALPDDLFDEVTAEDQVVYKDLMQRKTWAKK